MMRGVNRLTGLGRLDDLFTCKIHIQHFGLYLMLFSLNVYIVYVPVLYAREY